MPAIAGVFHLPGVFDDAVIARLDWAQVSRVLAPKTTGAWNLHVHTQQDHLDHFVLFSSAASVLGPSGQANYAAANAGLDAIAHLRHAQGLPALSVNWGPWVVDDADVERIGEGRRAFSGRSSPWAGVGSIDTGEGLELLARAMRTGAPQVMALAVDWQVFSGSSTGRHHMFSPFAQTPAVRGLRSSDTAAATLTPEVLAALAEAEQSARLVAFLRGEVARELGVREERIPSTTSLSALGLDSLMAVQLRNRVQQALACTIPVSRFVEGRSVEQLATELLERFRHSAKSEPVPAPMAEAPAVASVPDVTQMSDDEVERMLAQLLEEEQRAS